MIVAKYGFQEVEHTADWALRVWAQDLPTLFKQAVIGMNFLGEVHLDPGNKTEIELDLDAPDIESLLVSFLSEIIFWGEDQNLGFDEFDLDITPVMLKASITGSKIKSRKKEIKAVTFHNLEIQKTDEGFQVEIVFDV